MKTIVFALALALGGSHALAQADPQDHSAHHPQGAASAPGATADPLALQMKKMQEMHQRMQAARTPAERQGLMDEHMKLMQDGMEMMSRMNAGAGMGAMPGPSAPGPAGQAGPSGMQGMMGMHGAMERRMALMEQMMQMMVDREAAPARR